MLISAEGNKKASGCSVMCLRKQSEEIVKH